MRMYTFTILNNDEEEEYFSYMAYSISQAYFLLELDGISRTSVIDSEVA